MFLRNPGLLHFTGRHAKMLTAAYKSFFRTEHFRPVIQTASRYPPGRAAVRRLIMFDCHMHSKFSADSVMDAADACKAAISRGLDGIAFTVHVDFDYPGETFIVDFDRYMERMNDLAAVYEGKLSILRAIEAGIQPHVIEDTLKVVNSYLFDYVLASVHIIDGADPYVKEEYYQGKSKAEAYERYLKEIYNMIMRFGSFDMVGHFEYIIRYAQYADRTLRYADHRVILDSILKELVHQGRDLK
jgi:histidinol-phosphatase (PHP family)